MIITTIYRVHFEWHEYNLMAKFEQESPEFRIVSQDSIGTLYELRRDVFVGTKDGNTNEVRRSAEERAV